MTEVTASIAQIVPCTEAEGPGKRFAIWFQGCPLRCPGCCNPEMLSFDDQVSRPLTIVLDEIRHACNDLAIEGISLLGGEPIAHATSAATIAQRARDLGLSVMVYSGFTIEEIRSMTDENVAQLLALTDVLVDGPYVRELPERHRRWVGSSNQRVHFLSNRYEADDPSWKLRNTMEIRLTGSDLTVNGFPAPSAVGFWRRLPLTKVGHG